MISYLPPQQGAKSGQLLEISPLPFTSFTFGLCEGEMANKWCFATWDPSSPLRSPQDDSCDVMSITHFVMSTKGLPARRDPDHL